MKSPNERKIPTKNRDAAKKDFGGLCWLIHNRNRNQQSAIFLLNLLIENSEKIQAKKLNLFSQGLVGVVFSLWRAVFLAEKNGYREDSFDSAIGFLHVLIADNAINYAQDKKEKEWTFNYYVNNAKLILINSYAQMNSRHLVPKWVVKSRTPKELWEYTQNLIETILSNFASELGVTIDEPVTKVKLVP
jgi:hypothetical protein